MSITITRHAVTRYTQRIDEDTTRPAARKALKDHIEKRPWLPRFADALGEFHVKGEDITLVIENHRLITVYP